MTEIPDIPQEDSTPDQQFQDPRAAEMALRYLGYKEQGGVGPQTEPLINIDEDAVRGLGEDPADLMDQPGPTPDLAQTVSELLQRVEDLESQIEFADVHEKTFVARVVDIADASTGEIAWQEQSFDAADYGDFPDGRKAADGDGFTAFPVDPNASAPTAGSLVVMRAETDNTGQTTGYRYIAVGASGFFPVLVVGTGGGNGDRTTWPTLVYDLYALADTGYVTPLNLSGSLPPQCSRGRLLKAYTFAAPDGSVASAYYDSGGAIQLFDCQEAYDQTNCS